MTRSLPIVVHAEHECDYRIRVVFSDHTAKTIDFAPWLDGPIFDPLNDKEYFKRFFVEGGTVTWPNGADIAPEALYSARAVDEAA